MNINLTHSSYFYESVLFPCVKNFCKNKKKPSVQSTILNGIGCSPEWPNTILKQIYTHT